MLIIEKSSLNNAGGNVPITSGAMFEAVTLGIGNDMI